MDVISDGLIALAALFAGIYCAVLSRRLKRLMALDKGLGGTIAALSRQVDDMHRSLSELRRVSGASAEELRAMTARAEIAAGRLELLLATVQDRKARTAERDRRAG